MTAPHFAGALSTQANTESAVAEALEQIALGFPAELGVRPNLLAVFATHHHGPALEKLGASLHEKFADAVLIGCTGVGVIGGRREAEGSPGLSIWAGYLPDTAVRPFRLTSETDAAGGTTITGAPEIHDNSRASVLILCDPFSFRADAFLAQMEQTHPGVPVMGGMASGGMGPGQNFLITEGELVEDGALGVVIEGEITLSSVVSQGCRPVGEPWVITACERNLIQKLRGKSAVEAFLETANSLSTDETNLLKRAPFVGLAIDATKSQFERGDFLVRQILGQGPDNSLGVNDLVRRGQTVQFLVRDAESAIEDLKFLMESQGGGRLAEGQPSSSAGALLFSCNGRGSNMFEVPDHDLTCVREGLAPDAPVAGFFAAGEIGPVGGRNFLHGFTASVAVFRPRSD